MKELHIVTYVLVLVGALNWGLVGLFDMNLVKMILGSMPIVENFVYILVGAAAIAEIICHKSICKSCK